MTTATEVALGNNNSSCWTVINDTVQYGKGGYKGRVHGKKVN